MSEESHKARLNRLNEAAAIVADGELGKRPVSSPTVLHIVADTMRIRAVAFDVCTRVFATRNLHPDQKIRLEAKDLAALVSAAIHKYLHDNDVNI